MRSVAVKIWLFTLLLMLFMPSGSKAADLYLPPKEELLTGIGFSRIYDQGDYNMVPVFLDNNFDIRKFFYSRNMHPPGAVDFVWELEGADVFVPNQDAEAANNFLLKFGFLPSTSRWQPYFKGGVGALFETAHIHNQATQFNFNEYAGLGIEYFFNPNLSLSVEYRFRHFSNADIRQPNFGVNTNFVLIGVSAKI